MQQDQELLLSLISCFLACFFCFLTIYMGPWGVTIVYELGDGMSIILFEPRQ